jgi:hypothetical protein
VRARPYIANIFDTIARCDRLGKFSSAFITTALHGDLHHEQSVAKANHSSLLQSHLPKSGGEKGPSMQRIKKE